jgi:hyperosmotically inducible periplasmic protein
MQTPETGFSQSERFLSFCNSLRVVDIFAFYSRKSIHHYKPGTINNLQSCGIEIALLLIAGIELESLQEAVIASAVVSGIAFRDSRSIKEKKMIKSVLLCALALLVLGSYTGTAPAADKTAEPPAQMAPDNTGRNVRDRGGDTLTPGDQSENQADRTMTQQVRREILADKSLSTDAKNIKVITVNGVVTLRGPVNTSQEKSTIEAKAQSIAGPTNVDSQLEVVRR